MNFFCLPLIATAFFTGLGYLSAQSQAYALNNIVVSVEDSNILKLNFDVSNPEDENLEIYIYVSSEEGETIYRSNFTSSEGMGFPTTPGIKSGINDKINKSVQIENNHWSELKNIYVKMIAKSDYESNTIAFSLALDPFFPELYQQNPFSRKTLKQVN